MVVCLVRGEQWRVVSSKALTPGDRIRVTAVEGLTLHVEPTNRGGAMMYGFNIGLSVVVLRCCLWLSTPSKYRVNTNAALFLPWGATPA